MSFLSFPENTDVYFCIYGIVKAVRIKYKDMVEFRCKDLVFDHQQKYLHMFQNQMVL